jgi:Icc-related predicted phosphoesterase
MAVLRVAALADLHCTRTSQGAFQSLFASVAAAADLLLIAGDLTDYGLPDEAHVLAGELSAVHVPVVAVLGNHDFESGREADISAVLAKAGVIILDGDAREVLGIGIAGIKGFGG